MFAKLGPNAGYVWLAAFFLVMWTMLGSIAAWHRFHYPGKPAPALTAAAGSGETKATPPAAPAATTPPAAGSATATDGAHVTIRGRTLSPPQFAQGRRQVFLEMEVAKEDVPDVEKLVLVSFDRSEWKRLRPSSPFVSEQIPIGAVQRVVQQDAVDEETLDVLRPFHMGDRVSIAGRARRDGNKLSIAEAKFVAVVK